MQTDKPQNDTEFDLNQLKDIASAVMFAVEADNLEQVLQRIAHYSRELVKARYAALGVPDDDNGLRFFKVSGLSPEEVSRIPHQPVGKGLLGAIMHEREILRLAEMRDDPRAVGFPENHPHMTSLLGVPIVAGPQLFGMLYLSDREDGQPFSERDQRLIETMAGYAALAIAGSELRDREGRLALLEERERIGMELHDGAIQSLYAIGMQLELIRGGDVPPASLSDAIKALDTVIEDIRAYILNLKVDDYHRKTIRLALEDMVGRLYVPEGVVVTIDAPHQVPTLPTRAFDALCQMTNEALSNALRHSQATHIEIAAWQVDNCCNVAVRDDGRGFDLQALLDDDGLGLRNIQQRAQLYGGEVQIETQPGHGTRLSIRIPTK